MMNCRQHWTDSYGPLANGLSNFLWTNFLQAWQENSTHQNSTAPRQVASPVIWTRRGSVQIRSPTIPGSKERIMMDYATMGQSARNLLAQKKWSCDFMVPSVLCAHCGFQMIVAGLELPNPRPISPAAKGTFNSTNWDITPWQHDAKHHVFALVSTGLGPVVTPHLVKWKLWKHEALHLFDCIKLELGTFQTGCSFMKIGGHNPQVLKHLAEWSISDFHTRNACLVILCNLHATGYRLLPTRLQEKHGKALSTKATGLT